MAIVAKKSPVASSRVRERSFINYGTHVQCPFVHEKQVVSVTRLADITLKLHRYYVKVLLMHWKFLEMTFGLNLFSYMQIKSGNLF